MTVILTDQKPVIKPLPLGPCVCGASKDKFKPVLGGMEVCMSCGHERRM